MGDFFNNLDQAAAATTGTPAASAAPFLGKLDAIAIQNSGGKVPVNAPDTNWAQNAEIGFGHGMERLTQGSGQFADWLRSKIPLGASPTINAILGLTSEASKAISNNSPSAVTADEQTYQQTPVQKSFLGKTGNFVAQSLPFMFGPQATASTGANLLTRAGLGAAADTGTGALVGAAQPLGTGDSRLANTATYGGGAGITSFGGRLLAGGLGSLASKIPLIRDPVARYQVGKFLNEQAGSDLGPQTENAINTAQNFVPGFQPTTAGLTKNMDLGGIERAVAQNPTIKMPGGQTAQSAFLARGGQNRQAIRVAMDTLAPGSVEASPTDLAQNIGKTVNDIVDAAQKKESEIWNNKDFLKLPVNVTRVKQGVQSWMDTLPVDDQSALPKDILPRIQAIQTKYGPTAPFNEIKALRSNILADARGAENTSPNQARLLKQLGGQIMSNLGTGEGFTAQETAAGQAFRNASEFTRDMHATLDPLHTAISKAQTEESTVGPWLLNASKPVPERTQAFVTAGNKYLGNADAAPEAARDYLVNAITNAPSVTPKNPNSPVSSAGLGRMLKNNWPTIQKLFPDQARQDVLKGIQATSEMGDFTANLKPQDIGSDTTSKLLGNMWMSEHLGHGVSLGNIWGRGLGWAMTQDPATRQSILAQALLDPNKAAALKMAATGPTMQAWTKIFGIGGNLASGATASAGAQELNRMIQPVETQP